MPWIRWVNHASYVLTDGVIRMMTDPWLLGSAFHDGWDLICETKFTLDQFRDITHIWFSHEHPDHFAPHVLDMIDPAVRAKITVLFQETKDQKVIGFCKARGFKVQELRNHQWHVLSPGFRVLCGKVPFYDSWLLVETGGLKILNTNDCVVDGEAVAADIATHTGTVDVLLTQFSYANWIGNPEEVELRTASAREKLERVRIQVNTFAPKYTVPFASFVYFSHEENHYLNDAINTIDDAHDFILKHTATTPVILYPNDEWDIGSKRDNTTALAAYRRDYQLASKPLRTGTSVSLQELCRLSTEYVRRIRSKNSRLLMTLLGLGPLRYFDTVRLRVTDLARVLMFDFPRGLRTVDNGCEDAHVSLSSESLAYVLRFDWGFDTLMVNGRFRASQQNYKRLIKMFFLGPLNNTGRYLHPRTLFDRHFVARALRKLLGTPLGGLGVRRRAARVERLEPERQPARGRRSGYVSLLVQREVNHAKNEVQFDAPVTLTREAATQVLVKDG